MSFSAVTVTEGQSVDAVAPGAPAFVRVDQLDNRTWELGIQLPLTDSDGSELTGLTKLVVGTATMAKGENPFTGLSIEEIVSLPGVVTREMALSPSNAGDTVSVQTPLLNLGGFQAFAAAVSD